MKKYVKRVIVLLVIGMLYFLFRPIFVYSFGWEKLNNSNKELAEEHTRASFVKADSVLIKALENIKAPGISIAVGKNNALLWENAIGYADIESKKRIGIETRFRIGSVSKALTFAGLGILLAQEKINLSTKVKDIFPSSYEKMTEVTVEQLASHTSGIRNYGVCFCFPIWEYYNQKQFKTIQEATGVFANSTLLFSPGSQYSYSTYNYTMLSLLMEKKSDQKFLSFMEQQVFNPIGMKNTSEREEGDLATFYMVEKGAYKKAYSVNNSNKYAGGGYVSTPKDLVLYGNAILNNTLLKEEVKNKLFTPVKLTNGEVNNEGYAIGWRVGETTKIFKDQRKVEIVHHGGVAMGATSFLLLLPRYNISAAISINANTDKGISKIVDTLYSVIAILTHDDKVHYEEL